MIERAKTLSLLCHLLAEVAGLDRSGTVAHDLGTADLAGQRFGAARLAVFGRRRHICAGKKGEQVCPPTNAGGGRVDAVGHHRRGRKGVGTTLMVLMDADRTPLAVDIAPADQHEVQLIEPLLDRAVVGLPAEHLPLVYDKAADSDELRDRLDAGGFDLVCPHRSHRVGPPRQDRRKLQGKDRWKIERLNAWLKNLRRVRTRDEVRPELYHAFTSIACLFTILKTF